MYSVCTVCFTALLNPFVELWVGPDYLLPSSTVVIISMVFYITGINQIPSQYRSVFGLFRQARWVPMAAATLNVVFSIVLGKQIGLNGIFLATIIAKVCTFNIADPILIYKNGFCCNSSGFFCLKLGLLILLVVNMALTNFLVQKIICNGIGGFAVKAVAALLCSAGISFVFLGVGRILTRRPSRRSDENE
jgi:hypothetical protein